MERLRQLQIQSEGVSALVQSDNIVFLELSKQQVTQIENLPTELFTRHVSTSTRAKAKELLKTILLPEQLSLWNTLNGNEFVFRDDRDTGAVLMGGWKQPVGPFEEAQPLHTEDRSGVREIPENSF
jgi:hypothetical protein